MVRFNIKRMYINSLRLHEILLFHRIKFNCISWLNRASNTEMASDKLYKFYICKTNLEENFVKINYLSGSFMSPGYQAMRYSDTAEMGCKEPGHQQHSLRIFQFQHQEDLLMLMMKCIFKRMSQNSIRTSQYQTFINYTWISLNFSKG